VQRSYPFRSVELFDVPQTLQNAPQLRSEGQPGLVDLAASNYQAPILSQLERSLEQVD
jgi:hypothetical protein